MPQGKSTSRDARSYTLAKLERAEKSIEEGRGISLAKVKQRVQKWVK